MPVVTVVGRNYINLLLFCQSPYGDLVHERHWEEVETISPQSSLCNRQEHLIVVASSEWPTRASLCMFAVCLSLFTIFLFLFFFQHLNIKIK